MKIQTVKSLLESYLRDMYIDNEEDYIFVFDVNEYSFKIKISENEMENGYYILTFKTKNNKDFIYTTNILHGINNFKLLQSIVTACKEFLDSQEQEYREFSKKFKISKGYDFGRKKGFLFNLEGEYKNRAQNLINYRNYIPINCELNIYDSYENKYVLTFK